MSDSYENECIICLEPLNKPEEEIALLDCNHRYHFKCIQKWVKKSNLNKSCCICEQDNEIVNIIVNNPLLVKDRNIVRKKKKIKKKNITCCNIL